MRGTSLARVIGASVGAIALAVGLAGTAGASKQPHVHAQQHIHGAVTGEVGTLAVTLTGLTRSAGCPLTAPVAIVPVSGNAVEHENENSQGAWFTETITASANVVNATGTVLGTGHVTEWDGGAINQLDTPGKTVLITHFTADFEGQLTTGAALDLHGNGGRVIHDASVYLTGTTLVFMTTAPPPMIVNTHSSFTCS